MTQDVKMPSLDVNSRYVIVWNVELPLIELGHEKLCGKSSFSLTLFELSRKQITEKQLKYTKKAELSNIPPVLKFATKYLSFFGCSQDPLEAG